MRTKTIMIAAVTAVMCAGSAFARPHGGPGGHGGHHGPPPRMHGGFHHGGRGFAPPPPRHHGGHHHHHHHGWGPGGRGFVGGVVGGLVGGLVYDAITAPVRITDAIVTGTGTVVASPAPAVVYSTPGYRVRSVWVPGQYVDQVQPNGSIMRVWVPGHYEERPVYY